MNDTQKDFFPFEVRQVGIVVRDREKTMKQIGSLLGITSFRLVHFDQIEVIVHGKKTRCDAKLAFAQVGPIEIELLEPGHGESIWAEFLNTKGEGVHHVGIFVPDIDKESARFMKMGIGNLQSDEDDHVRFSYWDTEGIVGVIIDDFVKSATSALRCILRHCSVRYVRLIPQDLRALNLKLFTLSSNFAFFRDHHYRTASN